MKIRNICIIAIVAFCGTATAGEKLSGDALKAAYNDKTLIGVHFKLGGSKSYYSADGSVASVAEGSKRTGKWSISDSGDQRCVKWDHHPKNLCHYLEKNGDGTYALVHGTKGFTITEVSEILDGDQTK